MRHGMEVQLVTPYRVNHLQRYDVMVHNDVTSGYPPLVIAPPAMNSYAKCTCVIIMFV